MSLTFKKSVMECSIIKNNKYDRIVYSLLVLP